MKLSREKKRIRRKIRARAKIFGSSERPRLSVFRSNRQLYAQLIDDEAGKTLFGLRSAKFADEYGRAKKADVSRVFGKEFGRLAQEKKITKVVFDRSRFAYHGRIKAFAEGARESGLQF